MAAGPEEPTPTKARARAPTIKAVTPTKTERTTKGKVRSQPGQRQIPRSYDTYKSPAAQLMGYGTDPRWPPLILPQGRDLQEL